jgi:hypothetical protein
MAFRDRRQAGVSSRRREVPRGDPPMAVRITDRARSSSQLPLAARGGQVGQVGRRALLGNLVQALELLVGSVAIDLPPPAVTVSSGAEHTLQPSRSDFQLRLLNTPDVTFLDNTD